MVARILQMKLLKKLNRIILVSSLFFSAQLSAKIVALDIISIYENYSLVQEANDVIDEAESRFKRIVTTAEEEIKELEKKGNEAEIVKKRDEIQDIIDEEVETLHDQKDLYNTTINRNVQKTLDTLAKTKGYDLVLDKGYVVVDIEDITDEFLSQLEKNTSSIKNPVKK